MPAALPWQKRPPSLFARILAWCNGRVRGIASFAHRRLRSAEAIVADAGSSGEAPDLPRHSYDVSLLFRRMAALNRLLGKRVIGSGRANAMSRSMPRRYARCL